MRAHLKPKSQFSPTLPLTTGAVAAAAAKAAAVLWQTKKPLEGVVIWGPNNKWKAYLPIYRQFLTKKAALCWLKKPANHDYDITQGLLIGAKLAPRQDNLIVLKAGFGVGVVTKPGLPVNMGLPAINPVPKKHIIKQLKEVCPNQGATVTFFIPGGREKAKKTFNPLLGIVNGLSLIGTTGLVKPMSAAAYKKTLALKLTQAVKLGFKDVILVPGEIGARAAQKILRAKPEQIVMTSNYVGYLVKQAVKLGVNVVFLGHIGKVIKVAAGYSYTHSQATPDRLTLLIEFVGKWDASLAVQLKSAVTAEQAGQIIKQKKRLLLKKIAASATATLNSNQESTSRHNNCLATVIIDWQGSFLAADKPRPQIRGMLC